MNYIKIILTLLVAATAALAIVLRPAPTPLATVVSPGSLDAALDRRIDLLDIKDVPAETAVRMIGEKAGVDIHVYWNLFVKTGSGGTEGPNDFPRTEHVTLSLSDVSLLEAITCLFKYNKDRTFFTRGMGNRIEVLNDGLPGTKLRTEMYDVSDLLSDEFWRVKTPKGREDEVRLARMNDLLSLIESCNWINGIGGRISPLGGQVMVMETDLGHKRLEQIFTWLRQTR